MILKNLIISLNIINFIFFLIYLYILNNFLSNLNIRKKFILLLINLFIIIGIGFFYNLDGLILLFCISEFSVILIFIVMFSQLYSFSKQKNFFKFSFFMYIILLLNFQFFNPSLLIFKNFYSYYNIVLNDFYYIFNCYFEKQIFITLFTLFIITLYSVFFILLYFNLKYNTHKELKKKKNIFLLRKQNLIHQTNFNAKIRIFKSKN